MDGLVGSKAKIVTRNEFANENGIELWREASKFQAVLFIFFSVADIV